MPSVIALVCFLSLLTADAGSFPSQGLEEDEFASDSVALLQTNARGRPSSNRSASSQGEIINTSQAASFLQSNQSSEWLMNSAMRTVFNPEHVLKSMADETFKDSSLPPEHVAQLKTAMTNKESAAAMRALMHIHDKHDPEGTRAIRDTTSFPTSLVGCSECL